MGKNATRYYKQYDYISRYESFPYYYDPTNNRYYYGLASNLREDIPYVAYTVQPGDSYDSISFDKYGNSLFYWVICNFNHVEDSFSDPVVGSIIRIPSINSIYFKE